MNPELDLALQFINDSSDLIIVSIDDRGPTLPGAAPGRQEVGAVGSGTVSR